MTRLKIILTALLRLAGALCLIAHDPAAAGDAVGLALGDVQTGKEGQAR